MDTRQKLLARRAAIREEDREISRALREQPQPSKSDIAYWREKIHQGSYTKDGKSRLGPSYVYQFSLHGKRRTITLDTEHEKAAIKALRYWEDLHSGGWDKADCGLRPASPYRGNLTLGEVIARLEKVLPRNPTFASYVGSLRHIVARIIGLGEPHPTPMKRRKWKAQVDGTKFAELTAKKIKAWRDETAARNKIVANNHVRNCKCLLTVERLRKAKLDLKSPFDDVGYLKVDRKRAPVSVDAAGLFKKAQKLSPAEHKAFLLGLFAGFSLKACDCAEWAWFDWKGSRIVPQPSKFYDPKTLEPVELDPFVLELFRQYYQRREEGERFVVESFAWAKPKVSKSYHRLRAQKVFDGLNAWLRNCGINGPRPFETVAFYRRNRGSGPLKPSDLS